MEPKKTYYWNIFNNWCTDTMFCEANEITDIENVYEDIINTSYQYMHTLVELPSGEVKKVDLEPEARDWYKQATLDSIAYDNARTLRGDQLL